MKRIDQMSDDELVDLHLRLCFRPGVVAKLYLEELNKELEDRELVQSLRERVQEDVVLH